MRFQMRKAAAKISHLNVREEKHGEDPVVAVDVTVMADVPQDFLEQFAAGLKEALYMKDPEQVDLTEGDGHLHTVRFPQLGVQAWPGEFPAEFVIHGPKREADIAFTDARVKKMTFEPKNGGSVSLKFQCAVHPGSDGLGSLGGVLGTNVKISVKPGEEPAEKTGGDPLSE